MTIQYKTIALLFMFIFAFSAMLVAVLQPAPVAFASDQNRILGQLCDAPGQDIGTNCNESQARGSVTAIMSQVVSVASVVAGVVSTIVLVIAGLMYITSSGNPEQTAKARSAIIYALVGLGVALAARALVEFVLGEFT